MIARLDCGISKRFARKRSNSALALPDTGGAAISTRTAAPNLLSIFPRMRVLLARGFIRMAIKVSMVFAPELIAYYLAAGAFFLPAITTIIMMTMMMTITTTPMMTQSQMPIPPPTGAAFSLVQVIVNSVPNLE